MAGIYQNQPELGQKWLSTARICKISATEVGRYGPKLAQIGRNLFEFDPNVVQIWSKLFQIWCGRNRAEFGRFRVICRRRRSSFGQANASFGRPPTIGQVSTWCAPLSFRKHHRATQCTGESMLRRCFLRTRPSNIPMLYGESLLPSKNSHS